MKIGYIRVSTEDQNLDRQIEQLAAEGIDPRMIYSDKYTGASLSRPGLKRLLEEIKPGDCIYVTDFSRLIRSLTDLLGLIELLREKEVELISLTESWFAIKKDDPISQLMVNLIGALNKFVRDNISKATKEGQAAARARGRHPGRPRGLDPQKISKVQAADQLISTGYSVQRACQMIGLSRATYHRYKKQIS